MNMQIFYMSEQTTRQRNKAHRRTRILKSAAALMAQGGVQGLVLRELADAADVTVPTIYNLVGTREEVVIEVITDALNQMDQVLARVPDGKGIEQGLAAVESCFDLIFSQKELYQAVFRALYEMETYDVQAWMGSMFKRGGAVMLRAVEMATSDGDLRGELEPLPLAHNAFHALQGSLRMWALGALNGKLSRERARYALLVNFLADATPKGRRRIRKLLTHTEQALNH